MPIFWFMLAVVFGLITLIFILVLAAEYIFTRRLNILMANKRQGN
jgi:uncharacterized membrane protein